MSVRTMELGTSGLRVPVIAVGCMRIADMELKKAERFIRTAMESGLDFFDHADIYGGGRCEQVFADAIGMNAALRETMILQSKCGIVPGKRFDFSKEYILSSVDGILRRLKTEYLDVLLLHRPDALMEPEEVAAAFDTLEIAGKALHFGVSNQNPFQMELLRKTVRQPIATNQLQLSIMHTSMIDRGLHVNMVDGASVDHDGGVLDYCRLHGITIQAWSPFQYGFFEGVFLDNEKFPELNLAINAVAANYGVSNTTIAAAWLLRHPASIQVVTGTTSSARLEECRKAVELTLTREEWYQIYLAAGNILP
jgi:predicted oxidoreductase